MTSVSQFAQHLLKLDPQRNQARLTLYNFLKHVLEPTQAFSPAVLQAFYSRILQFEHWQNDSQSLSDTIRADVLSFLKHTPDENAQAWTNLRHPDTLQVVQLKVFCDLQELVETEHIPRRKSGEQLRLLPLPDENRILALYMDASGDLDAKIFPAMAIVWGSRLRLVAPTSHLRYASNFELMPFVRQVLEGSLLTTHCFHVDTEGVHGLTTRGHTWQKFETFIRAKLPETQDLFLSLKRIERHFINPQSDPYYQEMVSRLERANRLLDHPTPDNLLTAEKALNKGRICLKNIFPNDRLLTLLVTHLDYGLSQRRLPKAEFHDRPTQ